MEEHLLAQLIVPRPHTLDLDHLAMPIGVGRKEICRVGNGLLILARVVTESLKQRILRLQSDSENLTRLLV